MVDSGTRQYTDGKVYGRRRIGGVKEGERRDRQKNISDIFEAKVENFLSASQHC